MIRYSSYAVANYQTPAASAEIIYLDPLQVQYEELQKLVFREERGFSLGRAEIGG